MLYWRTTRSSSVAIKTGSTYICGSMRDIITIPTAKILPWRVCKKCQQVTVTSMTTGNSDMRDKTGNSYTTGTTTNSVEITTESQVFLTIMSPNKVSASDCDNVRQPEMALRPLKPEILISWTMTARMTILTANVGFAATPSSKKLNPSDCDNDRQPEMKT